jgi:hypothetical protein
MVGEILAAATEEVPCCPRTGFARRRPLAVVGKGAERGGGRRRFLAAARVAWARRRGGCFGGQIFECLIVLLRVTWNLKHLEKIGLILPTLALQNTFLP